MSTVTDILRAIVPTRDEAFGIAARVVTGLFENAQDANDARKGLAIAKLVREHAAEPDAYLDGLLDTIELEGQRLARARFGG